MITITSYLHRAELNDLIRRWMYDQAQPTDCDLITRLVHFNNVYVSRYLARFSSRVFEQLHHKTLTSRQARTKQTLKDAIVINPPYVNPRIQALMANYRDFPERYYRETPYHGTLFFAPVEGGHLYVGSNRIKRVRRLAEKSARRIIDRIFEAIKQHADALAEDRARKQGTTRTRLVSKPQDMLAEFISAESRLLDSLRNQRPIFADDDNMQINDVAGIKVILEDAQHGRAQELFEAWSDCRIIEIEPHMGDYNATNILVQYQPDKDSILSQPIGSDWLRLMQARGLDPDRADKEYGAFVRSGEDSVVIEVIVSNYQEMLESEIGKSMHEDRIIEQRRRQEYRGMLAKNVEYLLIYLFSHAVAPKTHLEELPIKLWNRYLPDYFDEVIKALYAIPPLHFES